VGQLRDTGDHARLPRRRHPLRPGLHRRALLLRTDGHARGLPAGGSAGPQQPRYGAVRPRAKHLVLRPPAQPRAQLDAPARLLRRCAALLDQGARQRGAANARLAD
jgi:hypothetical protein